jgi:hypothetical protein
MPICKDTDTHDSYEPHLVGDTDVYETIINSVALVSERTIATGLWNNIIPNGTASVVEWSEFLAKDPKAPVRSPALPDFLRSSGAGMGPLGLVSTIKELLGGKSSCSGL